jgi:NAD(P)-dependent dehydrogenase (short-subunit alcohol dehydrogenase family)
LSKSNQQTVIITGVAGGIGWATAKRFSSQNWRVYGLDRREPKTEVPFSAFYEIDLARPKNVQQTLTELEQEIDALDALINNAAIQPTGQLVELNDAEMDRAMNVNFKAPWRLIKSATPLLERSEGGSIINITSVHAQATSPEMGPYAASKAALESLTRTAAIELADKNIRVNAVAPGAVDTSMLREGLERDQFVEGKGKDFESFEKTQPFDRSASPEEIAEVIYFLAGKGSSFMSGSTVTVDSGVLARLSSE